MASLVGAAPAPAPASAPLAERALLGAFVHQPGLVEGDPAGVAALEALLGRRLDVVHDFLPWGVPLARVADRAPERPLLVSWAPSAQAVRDLAAGRPDAYVDGVVADLAAREAATFLRFGYEMNGSWNAYSAAADGGPSAAQFRQAWRELARRLDAAGADVPLVWCPNERDWPAVDGNRLEDYWPGADVVDVLGVDAYDWGSQRPRRGDGRHRSFEQVLARPYERVTALPRTAHLPVWLCETGTTEVEGRPQAKGDWYRDLYASTRFPRLAAVVHFSQDDQRDVQRDWRLDTSPESVAGLREALVGSGSTATASERAPAAAGPADEATWAGPPHVTWVMQDWEARLTVRTGVPGGDVHLEELLAGEWVARTNDLAGPGGEVTLTWGAGAPSTLRVRVLDDEQTSPPFTVVFGPGRWTGTSSTPV
ncbi:glycoside hydrolase family 26 protein [Pseudokineococcus sp. 1T1Z-3]|uniref:glycoside hydrolase family 26 protein n=1 Tax=Pseudokineococcus sp. 1T1Z-3 TaxID=3132745 RepID=UPI0030DAF444